MGESRERYETGPKRPRNLKGLYYKTHRIGVSTISDQQINVPKQVMTNYALKPGDVLEWYPCGLEFPDELEKDLIALIVVRSKNREEV